jgi:hypothetical protein
VIFLARSMPRTVRIIILAVALVAALGLATVSSSPAHVHTKASPAGCDICFVAHAPAVETPALHLVHAPEIAGRAAPYLLFFEYEPESTRTLGSRGPPSFNT